MHPSCDTGPGNRLPDGARIDPALPIELENPLGVADWDARLSKHPGATIFHTAAWARTLVETYRFRPRYLTQRLAGHVVGLLPLMQTGTRFTGRHEVSLPFTDSCPPLLPDPPRAPLDPVPKGATAPADSLTSRAGHEPLLAAALRLAGSDGCRSIELRDCEPWATGLQPSVVFLGHTVPLSESLDEQLSRCSPSMRRALRKAERSPLRLKEGRDLADVEAYYDLHCQTRQRHGLPPQPFDFFRNLHRHVLQAGLGFVVLAMDGDDAVAGAVYLGFGRKALYKFGASSESHLELRPNNLVLWQGIRRCAELGFSALDLGRTSLDNEGLRRFKLGLGGEERLIHYVRQDVKSGRIVATPDRAHGWHTQIFRRLPRPLSRALGRLLYRFVA